MPWGKPSATARTAIVATEGVQWMEVTAPREIRAAGSRRACEPWFTPSEQRERRGYRRSSTCAIASSREWVSVSSEPVAPIEAARAAAPP